MTHIESKKVEVNHSANDLFNKLIDFQSFGPLMPDSVTKFEADNTSFLFGMKGIPEVRLVLDEKQEPSLIQLKSASSKLDFILACHIAPNGENESTAYFDFKANFNPMLKMMVERPLKSFIENLADKLTEV